MLRKAGIVFGVLIIGSTFVFAAPSANFNNGINASLNVSLDEHEKFDKALDKVLNDKAAANNPLEVYHNQLAQVTKPSYETLLPVLQQLAAYNAKFAEIKDKKELRDLASKIAAPANAGWNNYRKIEFNEIFEYYIPDDQQDKNIALLEYNVKSNTISKEELENEQLLENIAVAKKFLNKMDVFAAKMAATKKFDGATVIKEFIPVIGSYEEMLRALPAAAKLARSATFKKPIACGWGRTYSVVELRDKVGVIYHAGGDAFEYKTAEDLERDYNKITEEEARIFANFTYYYYRMPNTEQENAQLFNSVKEGAEFINNYNAFVGKMEAAKEFDGKIVIKELVPVIKSYNLMAKVLPAAAKMAKTFTFKKPIACGWGDTINIVDLRDSIGVISFAGGDAFEYIPAADLQKKYKGITEEEAKLFADFTAKFYK